jgi:hypothetical protein
MYEMQKMERDEKGAYTYPESTEVVTVSENEIGTTLQKLFQSNTETVFEVNSTFKSINEKQVTYLTPSDNEFVDIGDGHTDAYQIYTLDEDSGSYIAFLIDNGYQDFSEESIRDRWKKMYQEMTTFRYEKITDSDVKIKVSAKTKSAEIVSHFYDDGDSMLEVITEISIENLSLAKQKEIKDEFEKIVKSIRIV